MDLSQIDYDIARNSLGALLILAGSAFLVVNVWKMRKIKE